MPANRSGQVLVGTPPLPREYAAWAMLCVPVVIAWITARPAPLGAALFAVASLCGLLAQHSGAALLQHRATGDLRWWLALELVGLLVSGASLVRAPGGSSLLLLCAIGTGLFGLSHAIWDLGRAEQKTASELVRSCAVGLSGPSAWVVSHGRLDAHAWLLYGVSIAVFWAGLSVRAPRFGRS